VNDAVSAGLNLLAYLSKHDTPAPDLYRPVSQHLHWYTILELKTP